LIDTKTGAFGFLVSKELERMEAEIENPKNQDYQFLVLRFKSANVTSRNIASLSNRRIALWSWHERLADMETRKPSSLASELKSANIDFNSIPPSLASRFYPVEESEEQWNTRLAIVSHRLDKPVEFQGTGDVMIFVDGEQRPSMASLMGQIMQSQMNALLQEQPRNQTDAYWTAQATTHAEKRNAAYFRATHVTIDLLRATSTVESVFIVKQPAGTWAIAWRSIASQNANDQKQDAIVRIKEYPQLKDIQTQLEQLAGSSASLDSAIRSGAATMLAQRMVDLEFQQFSESYLRRLNSPAIQAVVK